MTAETSVDIGTLIFRRPDFKGGDACVTGTGVRVKRLVEHYKKGYSAEEIARKYGHLSAGQVHAALAYYYANRQEIEDSLEQDVLAVEELKRAYEAGDPTVSPG
jgi:uncharacterized protein (DUF433 family)